LENDFAEKRHNYVKNLVFWSDIYHNEANGDEPKTQQEEIIHEKDPENERSGTQTDFRGPVLSTVLHHSERIGRGPGRQMVY
jgi:hypothetical protein